MGTAIKTLERQALLVGKQRPTDSSQRLTQFLDDTKLHKKDFAEMIGVTLSYVYSLINDEIPFSTRTTTLERITTVMGVAPEIFPEYKRSEEPRILDPGIEFLKQRQEDLDMTNVQLFKRFPRNQRLEMVDMWRGALPLPLDWAQLTAIAQVLELTKQEIYPYWQNRLQQYLVSGGIDPMSNLGLLNSIFQGVKSYLSV
jgi:transcriptional regulator with XRE-family HTH domain